MATTSTGEDYYFILEIDQYATLDVIKKAYRRLALKLHPDKNRGRETTAAFQLLGLAYDTLSDITKRRDYDRIYPTVRKTQPQTSNGGPQSKTSAEHETPHDESHTQPQASDFLEEINVLQKQKDERLDRWLKRKDALESTIAAQTAETAKLEQDIESLEEIVRLETALEAAKAKYYKADQRSAEEKERKNIERQERKMALDMKERRLPEKQNKLKQTKTTLAKAEAAFGTADRMDTEKIAVLKQKQHAKEEQERREKEWKQREEQERKERAEQERQNKEEQERKAREEQARKERERREQEEKERLERAEREWQEREEQRRRAREAERRRRQEEAAEKARIAREEEEERRRQELEELQRKEAEERQRLEEEAAEKERQARELAEQKREHERKKNSACKHDGWWDKEEGHKICLECGAARKFSLVCPRCQIEACHDCKKKLHAEKQDEWYTYTKDRKGKRKLQTAPKRC